MTDSEEGMTYVEKLDFREQAHRFEMERINKQEVEATKRAKYELRAARQETYQIVGIAFFVAAVILGIVFFIWLGNHGPESHAPSQDERRESSCMDHGGTWLPSGQLAGSEGMCVLPGAVPKGDTP
jgi:hypothetical protein